MGLSQRAVHLDRDGDLYGTADLCDDACLQRPSFILIRHTVQQARMPTPLRRSELKRPSILNNGRYRRTQSLAIWSDPDSPRRGG